MQNPILMLKSLSISAKVIMLATVSIIALGILGGSAIYGE